MNSVRLTWRLPWSEVPTKRVGLQRDFAATALFVASGTYCTNASLHYLSYPLRVRRRALTCRRDRKTEQNSEIFSNRLYVDLFWHLRMVFPDLQAEIHNRRFSVNCRFASLKVGTQRSMSEKCWVCTSKFAMGGLCVRRSSSSPRSSCR